MTSANLKEYLGLSNQQINNNTVYGAIDRLYNRIPEENSEGSSWVGGLPDSIGDVSYCVSNIPPPLIGDNVLVVCNDGDENTATIADNSVVVSNEPRSSGNNTVVIGQLNKECGNGCTIVGMNISTATGGTFGQFTTVVGSGCCQVNPVVPDGAILLGRNCEHAPAPATGTLSYQVPTAVVDNGVGLPAGNWFYHTIYINGTPYKMMLKP